MNRIKRTAIAAVLVLVLVGCRPSVYYTDCADARAAGVAPIASGQPGYRPALDRDNNGIACEEVR